MIRCRSRRVDENVEHHAKPPLDADHVMEIAVISCLLRNCGVEHNRAVRNFCILQLHKPQRPYHHSLQHGPNANTTILYSKYVLTLPFIIYRIPLGKHSKATRKHA